MAELTNSDAELIYKYARDGFRSDLEADAYTATLDAWQADRPDDYAQLEAANEDDTSTFAWEGLWLEMQQRDLDRNQDLVPMTGVEHTEEPEIADLASDFGWDYVAAVRGEVRQRQESTDYSPREFVALVLDAAENCPEEVAHNEMGVSIGNYRGKKGIVVDKHECAERTISVTNRVRA